MFRRARAARRCRTEFPSPERTMSVITGRKIPGSRSRICPLLRGGPSVAEFVEKIVSEPRTVAGRDRRPRWPRPDGDSFRKAAGESAHLGGGHGECCNAAFVAARQIAAGADRLWRRSILTSRKGIRRVGTAVGPATGHVSIDQCSKEGFFRRSVRWPQGLFDPVTTRCLSRS